jgi:hypothetical protein
MERAARAPGWRFDGKDRRVFTLLLALGAVAWPGASLFVGLGIGLPVELVLLPFHMLAPTIAGWVRPGHPWLWGFAPVAPLAVIGLGWAAVDDPRLALPLLVVLALATAVGAALAALAGYVRRRGPRAVIPPWI